MVYTYVISGGQSAVRSADLAAGVLEALKGLLQVQCQYNLSIGRAAAISMVGIPRLVHTGDVTSWTKCLSKHPLLVSSKHLKREEN